MGSQKTTESREFRMRALNRHALILSVRDLGVAGSNPVIPTTDSKVFFERTFLLGATFEHLWGLARGRESLNAIACKNG